MAQNTSSTGVSNADVYAPDTNIDITAIMKQFGYTPTNEEAVMLQGAFGAENNAVSKAAGVEAIAQYVNYQKQIQAFDAKDPLTGLQTRMNNIIDQNTKAVSGLSDQLQQTLSAAPQLFGSLTPDQISTYLAPLQTSFNQQLSQVQATMAARGLGASSPEANALAQTNQQFQQTVLSTGLNIGLTAQKNKADAIQQQINNLFGQTGQAINSTTSAAGQQSKQQLGESELIGSLPSFLNNQAQDQAARNTSAQDQGGFQAMFDAVTGDIGKGVNAAGKLYTSYTTSGASSLFSQPGGQPAPAGTNPMTPSFASTSPGGTNYQPPNLNASGYNAYGNNPMNGRPNYAQFEGAQ